MKLLLRFQALVLMGMGLFLYSRVSTGTVLFYINQRFVVLTLLTAIILMLVGISYYYRPDIGDGEEDVIYAGTGRPARTISWGAVAIMTLPIILGLLVPPEPLGASAVSGRQIQLGSIDQVTGAAASRAEAAVAIVPAGERNIMDWLVAFQRAPDPASFDDQEANVVGFIFRDERFGEDKFMVSRFIVSCCVADAAPIGLIVHWPDAPSLRDDQWVEVQGRFEVGEFDGRSMPILIAESVTITNAPAQPYLYY